MPFPTTTVPDVELNDGHHIPQLGFGVFQIAPEDTASAVHEALDIGYRHIDTAEMYRNERGVGDAVRASGLDRADVFVTSKLSNRFHRPDDARRAFDRTLSELGFEYVDLFLIHWPLPTLYDGDFVSTWRTLEEFRRDGRARSIGVSNFQVDHLERLAAETDVVPAVNQIELHPYFGNAEVRAYGHAHGIATEAWSPIAQGAVLDDPVITTIAESVGRSCCAGTSNAVTSSSPSPSPRRGSGRTSSCSTSSSRPTTSPGSIASTTAPPAGAAATRTPSPGSPTEPGSRHRPSRRRGRHARIRMAPRTGGWS
jgi:2,5-diketo-D-gluconate reductase A